MTQLNHYDFMPHSCEATFPTTVTLQRSTICAAIYKFLNYTIQCLLHKKGYIPRMEIKPLAASTAMTLAHGHRSYLNLSRFLCFTPLQLQKEDMAGESYDEAITSLNKLLSEKTDLGGVAAAKIKELTAELEAAGSKPFNPDERIRTRFLHFKTKKYEYVTSNLYFVNYCVSVPSFILSLYLQN